MGHLLPSSPSLPCAQYEQYSLTDFFELQYAALSNFEDRQVGRDGGLARGRIACAGALSERGSHCAVLCCTPCDAGQVSCCLHPPTFQPQEEFLAETVLLRRKFMDEAGGAWAAACKDEPAEG